MNDIYEYIKFSFQYLSRFKQYSKQRTYISIPDDTGHKFWTNTFIFFVSAVRTLETNILSYICVSRNWLTNRLHVELVTFVNMAMLLRRRGGACTLRNITQGSLYRHYQYFTKTSQLVDFQHNRFNQTLANKSNACSTSSSAQFTLNFANNDHFNSKSDIFSFSIRRNKFLHIFSSVNHSIFLH